MVRYAIQRLLWVIPTALAVVLVTFFLMHLMPGDPARAIAGMDANQATVEGIREQLGLDQPMHVQVGRYLRSVVTLDLGTSVMTKEPVARQLRGRVLASLELAVAGTALAVVLGIPMGILAAIRRGSLWDMAVSAVSGLAVAFPHFWVGLMLILVFAVMLGWLPPAGRGGPMNLILPAITLAALPMALLARMTRAAFLDVLSEDFVRTARSKGASERRVHYFHALKNAMLPVVTVLGVQFGLALNGAVVVETVFNWPGMGRLLVDAILRRDFPVVQGAILVIALLFLFINLLVDLTYGFLDPRVQTGHEAGE